MGKRKIIVSERDNLATLFEGEQAIEFIINRGDMLLGDIYLCTVENILPSIDAAFVNVGGDKMGFLHASDVQGKGDLKTRLQPKQQLVVQIMKEPTGHKGPRVSTNISLPGRFLVLMPESKGISISRKIEAQSERARLKSVVGLVKPPGVGVIIRTEAGEQKDSDIQEDFETLLERWQSIVAMADTAAPPTLLYRDQDLLYRVIREVVSEDVTDIYVDTTFGQQRAQQLLQNWNMDKNIKVNLYSGNQSILMGMGVDKEIKQALQTKVPLPLGGYLFIQTTEALTVVDVNSGKFTSLQSQSETIKVTNLEATKEIARQLRLRNIGGMIIVDFIDMESRADKLIVLEAFENALAPDKAKPQIGQLSDLGLVELTRHRQGQALSEIFTKRCLACSGTGHALEEFNWAPPSIDGDGRMTFNPRQGSQGNQHNGPHRHKLPIRSPRPLPQQQAPITPKTPGQQSAQIQNQSAQDAQNSPPAGLSLKKILEAKNMVATIDPIVSDPNKGANRSPGFQGAGNNKPGETGSAALPSTPVDLRPLDEIFKEKLFLTVGARLASVVKVAIAPQQANNILARINPKSNDIQTLISILEGGGSIYPFAGDLNTPENGARVGQENDSDRDNESEEPEGSPERADFVSTETVVSEENKEQAKVEVQVTVVSSDEAIATPESIALAESLEESGDSRARRGRGRGRYGTKDATKVSAKAKTVPATEGIEASTVDPAFTVLEGPRQLTSDVIPVTEQPARPAAPKRRPATPKTKTAKPPVVSDTVNL